MNLQDVSETRISLIDAQRFAVKYDLCRGVIGQDMDVLEKSFRDFLVHRVVGEDWGHFLGAFVYVVQFS